MIKIFLMDLSDGWLLKIFEKVVAGYPSRILSTEHIYQDM